MPLCSPSTSSPPSGLSLHVHRGAGASIWVTATGELDLVGAPCLEATLGAAQARVALVVLDLSGLTFCDSAGVHAIANSQRRARAAGGTLTIIPAPPAVDRVFVLTAPATGAFT